MNFTSISLASKPEFVYLQNVVEMANMRFKVNVKLNGCPSLKSSLFGTGTNKKSRRGGSTFSGMCVTDAVAEDGTLSTSFVPGAVDMVESRRGR